MDLDKRRATNRAWAARNADRLSSTAARRRAALSEFRDAHHSEHDIHRETLRLLDPQMPRYLIQRNADRMLREAYPDEWAETLRRHTAS